MKRIMMMLLILTMLLCVCACDNNSTGDKDNNTSTDKDSIKDPIVGRWVEGYYTNSSDADFEDCAKIMSKTTNSGPTYFEFYSNGTGVTNWYSGDYYENDGVVFEWEYVDSSLYDKEVLCIHYASDGIGGEVDENGYYVSTSTCIDHAPKDALHEGEMNESTYEYDNFDEAIETVYIPFISQHEPFVKVTEDFKDNPDLGCKDAFKSIKTYRNDPDAYKEQFE